jgi:hypothetical protein
MTRKDYLPRSDRGFLDWINNFLRYLMARVTKFNVPQSEYDGLDGERNTYAQKLEVAIADATRTPLSIQGKNVAKRVLEKHSRKFVKEYLIDNHLLTEEDLKMLGLPIHDTQPTPAPPITTHPKVEVAYKQLQQHIITVRDEEGKSTAKPKHAAGFEIWRKVGGTAPVDDPEWQLAGMALRSPHTLNYREAESGERVYYRARWINTRGLPGPWSRTESAVIP